MNVPLPEWSAHEAMWIGFPSDAELWGDDLAPAQSEVAALAHALHAGGSGEQLWLVAASDEAAAEAARLVPFARILVEPFGDVWLRDTAPIVLGSGGNRHAQGFGFNGWGGKYELAGDEDIGERLARRAQLPFVKADWILEGGAVEGDGAGTFVTTEQCLLNPNRNPELDQAAIEARLNRDLGANRVIWLGDGLANDHTDGHVDNLARFVAPGRVVVPEAAPDDPNAAVYAGAAERLLDAGLDVAAIPSPGAVERDGEIVPASAMNFVIGNAAVVVPLYGSRRDPQILAAFEPLFPGRRVVGLRADHLLTGGGSFHCITQQVPT